MQDGLNKKDPDSQSSKEECSQYPDRMTLALYRVSEKAWAINRVVSNRESGRSGSGYMQKAWWAKEFDIFPETNGEFLPFKMMSEFWAAEEPAQIEAPAVILGCRASDDGIWKLKKQNKQRKQV